MHHLQRNYTKKRGKNVDVCSHKPGYVMQSAQQKQRGKRRIIFNEAEVNRTDSQENPITHDEGANTIPIEPIGIEEQELGKSMWAIRRMSVYVKRKCMGCVGGKKCQLFVESKTLGEVAPYFWSF